EICDARAGLSPEARGLFVHCAKRPPSFPDVRPTPIECRLAVLLPKQLRKQFHQVIRHHSESDREDSDQTQCGKAGEAVAIVVGGKPMFQLRQLRWSELSSANAEPNVLSPNSPSKLISILSANSRTASFLFRGWQHPRSALRFAATHLEG